MKPPKVGDAILYTDYNSDGTSDRLRVWPGVIVRVHFERAVEVVNAVLSRKAEGLVNLVHFNDEYAEAARCVMHTPYVETPNVGGTWRYRESESST